MDIFARAAAQNAPVDDDEEVIGHVESVKLCSWKENPRYSWLLLYMKQIDDAMPSNMDTA